MGVRGWAMITLQDCISLCGLSEAEVLAIAEHEHVPEVVAAALADELLKQAHGTEKIRHMIVEDIRAASARGDTHHVRELLHCLKCFLETHPEAVPATMPSVTGPQT
jgi:DNA repair protein RadC